MPSFNVTCFCTSPHFQARPSQAGILPETPFGPASSLHWDVPPFSLVGKFSLEQVKALNCGHHAFLYLSFYGQCTEVECELLFPTILLWNIFGYYWCLQAMEEATLS